jgi:replicative DNA helicase
VEDLLLTFKTNYPASKDENYLPIFNQLDKLTVEDGTISTYLETTKKRSLAKKVALTALSVSEGTKDWEDLATEVASLASNDILTNPFDEDFVNETLETLEQSQHLQPGLRWRLNSLNRALGSLRTGDFGFVFARPETGKTTFLASEITFMAGQTDRPILWFNNEEQGGKVLLRCYQGAIGRSTADIWSDKAASEREFATVTKGNIRIVRDPTISKRRVEELCKQYKPALIIFDQIDKIKGFHDNDRNDIELKAIYVWAREVAKIYAPVIAICQAGASGDGKRWLTMNDVDNSKTGKQGEADWILGIGKVYDDALQDVRFLHLSKNKLLGDTDADESLRHGKWEVRIKPEVARYEDF